MATKKSSKSTKTAHVLNVIAGAQEREEEVLLEGAPAAAPAAHSRPVLPPILEDARANDEALGEQIQDALSRELEEELWGETPPPAVPASVEEPVQPEHPPQEAPEAPQPPPEAPMPPPPSSHQEEEIAPPAPEQSVQRPSVPQPARDLPAASPVDDGVICVNIMQALVEEKVQKYMKMFDLCSCSRCAADVKALALSSLPPKYAVMGEGEVIPMLTVYEGRYSTALTAQIMAACKTVMEHPRHKP